MDSAVLSALSLALGLGLLIGLQRERTGSTVGGIRTFPLIALLGAMCGLLASVWTDLVIAAGFIGVASMAVLANLTKYKEGTETTGQTTEVAALLTYALGPIWPPKTTLWRSSSAVSPLFSCTPKSQCINSPGA